MNCRKATLLINELLDGEIRDTDRQQLQAHLESCHSCRQLFDDLARIKERFVRSGDITPSDRVWEKLKNRLQAEIIPQLQAEENGKLIERRYRQSALFFRGPRPVFKYAFGSLVLLVFIAGAFFLGRYYQKSGKPQLRVSAGSEVLQKLQEAEYYYQQTVQSLARALESSRNGLPPEMAEILGANLELLDRTIELARQAVGEQPDNFEAREFLLSAYSSKVSFLNRMLETRKSFVAPKMEKL